MTVSPFTDPAAWDRVKISVGVASGSPQTFVFRDTDITFSGPGGKNDWDIKKPKGADGATKTDNGYVPTKIKMKVLLWKDEHFQEYVRLVKAAKPKPGKGPKPIVTIQHPQLLIYDLTSFDVEEIPIIDFKQVDQWEAELELSEWFPEPKKTTPNKKPPPPVGHLDAEHFSNRAYRREQREAAAAAAALPSTSVRPVR